MTLVRLRRLSLTTRCALANLVVVAVLGVCLSAAVSSVVRAEATAEARRSGEMAAVFVQHALPDAAYLRGLRQSERERLHEVVEGTPDLRSLRIWGPHGRVLFDSDRRLTGGQEGVQ